TGDVRETLRSRPVEPVKVLILAAEIVPAPVVAPLVGLLKTAAIENPKIAGRVISIAGKVSEDRLMSIARAEMDASDTLTELRYDTGGMRQAWGPVSDKGGGEQGTFATDPDGVYWVTGGLGGLGRIFAEWLV
ncbi:hypothetical protein, partial [Pseudomonas aeruginosa]|uniref:hypothetical protein n=1 Tax=Pseudomonas aeruginosa TaxID=287 RepID=UPI0015EBD30D